MPFTRNAGRFLWPPGKGVLGGVGGRFFAAVDDDLSVSDAV
ncbi:hypothetical protein QFZ23_002034 [Arthrobacter globiformis]|nr:hypothetical protein [Arthrobacter globiformis]MDQ1058133.1 hypothetical protein [Arthrobacter globiformis]